MTTTDYILTDADHAQHAEEEFYATNGDECDVDREDRRFIDYADVADPEVPVVRRYGSDDPGRVLAPGASD